MLLLALVALLFFCSGASALIYQVLWLRKLGLVFGVTVYAASTVWAGFMFGLAVGSLLSGRLADRVRRPLVWFGVAEALIAVSAVCDAGRLERLAGSLRVAVSVVTKGTGRDHNRTLPDGARCPSRADRADGCDAAARGQVVVFSRERPRPADGAPLRVEHRGSDRRHARVRSLPDSPIRDPEILHRRGVAQSLLSPPWRSSRG